MECREQWEKLHVQGRFRPKYPHELVVSFVFRKFTPTSEGVKILDVGCGAGRHTLFLARENYIPYAIDISEPAVNYTKSLLEKENLGRYAPNIRQGSFTKMPFDDEYFDGAIAYGTLYYVDAAGAASAVNEILRVLKPGGKGLVVVRSRDDSRCGMGEQVEPETWRIDFKEAHESANAENGMIVHFFSREELRNLFGDRAAVKIDLMQRTLQDGRWLDSDFVIEFQKRG